jgi:hypothetical protein
LSPSADAQVPFVKDILDVKLATPGLVDLDMERASTRTKLGNFTVSSNDAKESK